MDQEDDDSREEMISYNFRPIEAAPARFLNNQRNYSKYNQYRNGGRKSLMDFDEREIYYFGVVQLSPVIFDLRLFVLIFFDFL